jgi:hypothetical protein
MSQNNDSSIEMSKVYKKSQSLEKETNWAKSDTKFKIASERLS